MSGERAYRELHWGLSGDKATRRLEVADPRRGELVELGTLRAVEYETEKYGDGLSVYRHRFERPYPILAVQVVDGAYGGLVIVGGGYTVSWRGIVR